MAGLGFTLQSIKVTFVAATQTLIQLVSATNTRVKVKEWSISFDGTSNTATPIEVDLIRQTSAGTFTHASVTMMKIDSGMTETIQTTAQDTATAEPTNTAFTPLWTEYVHPQTGYTWQAPFGGEIIMPGATRLGLRLVAPAAGADAFCRLVCEE